MSQLIVQQLTKTIGDKTLYDRISFTITEGEKIGLLGRNGCGKSTLLQILAGEMDADVVSMDHPNAYSMVYLSQNPELTAGKSILEVMFESDIPVMEINRKYEQIRHASEANPGDMNLINELLQLQEKMEQLGGWEMNTAAKYALTKLGITEFDRLTNTLSGGQQKRVALARALIEPHDLLLLDEPTNHLDIESTQALEELVKSYKGSVLFVTHDRLFLNHVTNSIYEIDQQQLFMYKGNYETYLENKVIRQEQAAAEQSKIENLYRNELKWVRRGAKARTTKQKARLDRFDEIAEKALKKSSADSMEMNLSGSRLGKKVMEGNHLSKSFGDRVLFQNFSFILQAKDRIGILGENGAGKSTLMNILAGKEYPTKGSLDIGSTVRVGYFTQQYPEFNPNQRVLHYIVETSNAIQTTTGESLSAVQMLERFLFPTNVHGTPIGKLSGGEKKRLYLLKLLMEQPNVLLLDEPTNDLDLDTLAVLEDYLDSFGGVVIVVSHDRYFLDRVTEKLWVVEKQQITETLDSYQDYIEKQKIRDVSVEVTDIPEVQEPVKEKRKRLSYHEKKEWETIEQEIEQLEEKISLYSREIESAGSDYEKIRLATIELEKAEALLEDKMERWAYLEEIVSS
ncbi:ABC-F family ATP-binding cassette domain-containing protein [Chryseomicrobium palamuruense]|uniref:ABC-F family ATP-binding cassette domain-containing protein n=1 Tax=Chryseomicrobium palamuruense TaxID=682973 RepID=A0ABV8UVX3_9BACL